MVEIEICRFLSQTLGIEESRVGIRMDSGNSVSGWIAVAANIGVIVGLVFVGLEIRNGSNAIMAQMPDSVADGFNSNNELVVADAAFARTFMIGLDEPGELTDVEAVQLSMFIRNAVNHMNRVFALHKLGLISDEQWNRIVSGLAGLLATAGGQAYLNGNELPVGLKEEILQNPKSYTRDFRLGRGT